MPITGIIAEYDPFHNGHQAHIAAARAAGATHIAVTISGSFTQRGEPALLTKWARARMAIANGADLVLELPLPWAMAPAETFALGGVATLHALGCIDTLSFGSECGDAAALADIAATDYREPLQAALAYGKPYAAALQAAVAAIRGDALAGLLNHPNNTLGIEYIRAATRLGAPFAFHTVPRIGAAHNADAPQEHIASASLLRQHIRDGQLAQATTYMPSASAAILQKEWDAGHISTDTQRLEYALLAQLRTLSPQATAALPYLSEGLENRLQKAIRTAESYDSLMKALKTRRYPAARLRRILWAALLEMPATLPQGTPPYIRVLAMNERGKDILAAATPTVPIISQRRHMDALSPAAQAVLALEQRATDLHALTMPRPLPCGTDLTNKIICE